VRCEDEYGMKNNTEVKNGDKFSMLDSFGGWNISWMSIRYINWVAHERKGGQNISWQLKEKN